MKKDLKLDLWAYLGIPALAVVAALCYPAPLIPNALAAAPDYGRLSPQTSVFSLPPPDDESEQKNNEPDSKCPRFGQMSYSQLRQCLDAKVTSISGLTAISGRDVVIARSIYGDFEVAVPNDNAKTVLADRAVARNIFYDVQSAPFNLLDWISANIWLVLIGSSIALTAFLSWRQHRQQNGQSGSKSSSSMLKSNAKDYKEVRKGQKKLTFDDIRGCDEAVEQGKTIVDMHENFPIYKAHKAPFPRGFLLVGPPGVGKTLWVRTLADVLDGEVFVTAGSEFVEMYVGVGASRARDLVEKARAKALISTKPVLILIDEIDGIGGKRGARGGGNEERESTLNQLLVEMDGLLELGNIIFVGATNRPEMLDPALLRRLANRIVIDLPDLKGRADILDLYVKELVLASDVSLPALAKITYTFSGDQLKKGVDYAATLAAKRCVSHRKANKIHRIAKIEPFPIGMSDFARAFDYIMHGDELPSKQANLTQLNKRNTALHEACHLAACRVFHKMGWIDKAVKATIMRRSRTLGFVMTMPEEERTGWDHRQCLARIIMAMAGRAGQEVFLDTRDSGASGDFQMATDMAREMVMKWGMSDLGVISIGARGDGSDVHPGLALADKMDQVWMELCNKCMDIARSLVKAELRFIKAATLVLEEEETILETGIERLSDAIPAEFDVAALDIFGRLEAYEEKAFDDCDIGPVGKYLQLMSSTGDSAQPREIDVTHDVSEADADSTTSGDSSKGEGEVLTEGAIA